jgi:acetoin utilization deacetylase AcuC-like enzyme
MLPNSSQMVFVSLILQQLRHYMHFRKDPEMKVSILDWDVHYGQGVADIINTKVELVTSRFISCTPFRTWEKRTESLESTKTS